jgi:flagellar biosynthesis protein FlhG
MDQAEGIRKMQARPPVQVLSVTSGKGGVGKTSMVTNLAVRMARRGRRVLVIDADLGLANVDILFGIAPRWNLTHVLAGEKRVDDVLVAGPAGVHVLPAPTGVQEVTQLSDEQKWLLLGEMDALEDRFDTVIIDTGAGIGSNVLYFASAANDVLVVSNPEPTALTDAYAAIKVLSQKCGVKKFKLLVNSVANEAAAREVYEKLGQVADRFLRISLEYVGHVVRDENVNRAILAQKPLVELYPSSPAARCVAAVADRLMGEPAPRPDGGLKFLWRKLFRDTRAEEGRA